ncbi:hypothetical protein [Stratiformator vulcanicus]|nr:hypothetical protein [Stratiformator vulcanicus]
MDRVAVDALNRFSERWLFYRGLVHWAGFRKAAVDYDAPPRFAGSSSYSLTRMFNMGLDAVFSFSLLPLRVSHVFGVICMFSSMLYGVWAVAKWMVTSTPVPGYTSLAILVTFIGSLNLLTLGIVSEYVGRIHEQVKGRPVFLIKESIGFEKRAASDASDTAHLETCDAA